MAIWPIHRNLFAALVGIFALAPTTPALGLGTDPSAATASQSQTQTFAYAGGETGRREIEAAIDLATEDMNILIRGIARRKLREANQIIPQLSFALSSERLDVRYIEGRWISAPADGTPVRWTDQYGEEISVQHTRRGNTVVQRMQGEGGKRRNVYSFDEQGHTLTMDVTIESSRLPEPVRYRVRYRQTG